MGFNCIREKCFFQLRGQSGNTQKDNAGMDFLESVDQFTKILVRRQQDSIDLIGIVQDLMLGDISAT